MFEIPCLLDAIHRGTYRLVLRTKIARIVKQFVVPNVSWKQESGF